MSNYPSVVLVSSGIQQGLDNAEMAFLTGHNEGRLAEIEKLRNIAQTRSHYEHYY